MTMSNLKDHMDDQDKFTAAFEAMTPEQQATLLERLAHEVRRGPDRRAKPQPRPFSVNLAVTVRAYGSVCVMATSMAEAIETVRAQAEADANNCRLDENVWDQVTDVDWENETDYTISTIQDDEGDEAPHDGISLCDEDGGIISADNLRAALDPNPHPNAATYEKFMEGKARIDKAYAEAWL